MDVERGMDIWMEMNRWIQMDGTALQNEMSSDGLMALIEQEEHVTCRFYWTVKYISLKKCQRNRGAHCK